MNRSNVVYRRDLDDFNKQDITVVMFPRDTTLERPPPDSSQRSVTDDSTAKKKGMVIVPTATQTVTTVQAATDVNEETKNEETKVEVGPGKQRKLSKTFSFLSKKEKGEKKKSTAKEKKRLSVAEKKLSSGGLSGISMPNLHSPSTEEPLSPEAQGPKIKIFRRKNEKKSNVQRTSWTFQQSIPNPQAPIIQPAVSLQNIAESPTDLPSYEMVASDRVGGSMEHIPQFSGDDLQAPVTVFGAREDDEEDGEGDNELPSSTEGMYDTENNSNLGNLVVQDRSPSPLSIGSISIDIPDLDSVSKPLTPLPTPNDITSKPLDKKTNTNTPAEKRNETSSTVEKENRKDTGAQDMPKRKDDTPANDDTPKSKRKEDTPANDDTPKSKRKEDTPKIAADDETPKVTRKEDTPTTGKVTDTGTTETVDDIKNFKRNLGSRRPLRKQSFTGKESPNLKQRYSSMRATPESPSDGSISPSVLSLKSESSDSPRTTPTITRKNIPKSPNLSRVIVVEKKKTSVHKQTSGAQDDGTPTNSPKAAHRFTPSPTKTVKRSPSHSPLSSPVATRKAKGDAKSPLTTPTATRKSKKSSLTNLAIKTSPNVVRKSQQESTSSPTAKTSERPKPLDSPATTRKRRLGITSITSPLSEEKNLCIAQPGSGIKIIPKRSAPLPPEGRRTSATKTDTSDIVKSPTSPVSGDKTKPKVSTPVAKRKSVPSTMRGEDKTSRETYVYQSRYKKSSATQSPPPPPANKESQTYKYSTGSFGKKTSVPAVSTSPTKERSSGRGKQTSPVVSDSQKKLSTPGMKKSSVDSGGLKPPSAGRTASRQARSETNLASSIRRQQKLSLAETGTCKETPKVVKASSEEHEEKHTEEPSTLDILKPLDSILTLSTDKLTNGPFSPPPFGSMLARPISPTSPPFSPEEEGDISLTPEVPMDREDKLTYIYRSTLLRKTSSNVGENPLTRTPSSKSIGSESGRAPTFSRTSSPRKSVSGSPSRQSKKSSSGSPFRKGSLATSTLRRGSATQTLSRRPSSGLPREKTASSTLGRPRSASQINIYQSLRRSSRPSIASSSSLVRQSMKSKKTSVDSVNNKKTPIWPTN